MEGWLGVGKLLEKKKTVGVEHVEEKGHWGKCPLIFSINVGRDRSAAGAVWLILFIFFLHREWAACSWENVKLYRINEIWNCIFSTHTTMGIIAGSQQWV